MVDVWNRTSKKDYTNVLDQHNLKLQLLNRVLPKGAETLVDKYVM
jgi:uncharacterized protein YukE